MSSIDIDWRIALDAVDDIVVLTEAATERIVWLNAAGVRAFGYDGEDLVGRSLSILLPDLRLGEDGVDDPAARMETRGRRRSGAEFTLQVSAAPGADGTTRIFVIRAAARAALVAMRARVATFAHEFNQPLAAASAFVGSAQRLLRVSPDERVGDPEHALLRAIEQIDRMSGVMARLRVFVAEFGNE